MNSDWPIFPLEDCLDALIDYRGKTPEKTTSGIPLVTAKIIKNGRIEKAFEYIANDAYDLWMRRGIPQQGDVVLTTEAPLGEVAQLGKGRVALAQRVVTLRGRAGRLDSTYLLYLLQTEEMQDQLRARATGTTVLGIKQSELRKVSVMLPPFEMQKKAASVLAAIDARIDILRETNTTLEAIAQALFKSWFVDFDPVRAKQEGREPDGMDAETAALFPDSLEESKLGLVPKGWSVGTIDQATSMIIDYRGKTPKKLGREWSRSGIPAVSAKNIKRGRLVEKQAMNFVDGELFDLWMKDKLAPGDVLMTSEAPLGELLYLAEDHNFCLSQRVFAMRANPINCFSSFLYFSLTSSETQERLSARATGTTVVGIRQSELRKVEMLFPPLLIQKRANDILSSCLLKIEKNESLNETLTTLRDTLLPRLISGQLRLPEAADQVKRAA